MEVLLIEVSSIVEDPKQPRQHHSEESLQGLADSIRQHGLLNPITVTPLANERYRIITGERRWRAAKMARLEVIPCVLKTLADEERLTIQLIENLQREDLQPLEKAKAIQYVKTSLNLTNRELAKRLGLSERSVGYLIDLLALPEEISENVVSSPNRPSEGQITEKHARYLKQLNDEPELQNAVVDRIRDDKLNTEDTGNLVKALKKKPEKAKEILDSPTDHLVKFFNDDDNIKAFLGDDSSDQPATKLSSRAQQIMDMRATLMGVDLTMLPRPELRQMEDSLTSLKLSVEGLLQGCKTLLG